MADLDKTPQEELIDLIKMGLTRLVIGAVLFGSGYAVGAFQYGDAPDLRTAVKQKQDRIVDLENERETTSTKIAKVNRDREVCSKDLKGCKGAGAATVQ